MKFYFRVSSIVFLAFLTWLYPHHSLAQQRDSLAFIRMPASAKYQKSSSYQKWWGTHYREEWKTPVLFRKVNLDTLAGGLTPYQTGGGRQSQSLRLRDKQEREYVLRSIDKSFGRALPPIAQNTFIEDLVDDQVTIGHPYAALMIAPLAEAAGILHTNPSIIYIPRQPALDKFNDSSGNILYLFEQRPDENWETAPNFGNSKQISGTDKMLENLLEDNDHTVQQDAYVRARLFDMLIGDWGRHEDQWRWARFKDDDKTTYLPIPRDRDQAFTKFDGTALKLLISVAGLKHLQTFDHNIKDIEHYNFPARFLDRRLLNEVSWATWQQTAKDLQARMTDAIIDHAVQQLPPEVYPISGPGIAAKLKSRRAQLENWARAYYLNLARNVDIPGSEKNELFDIKRNGSGTEVSIYKIKKDGSIKSKPIYHRVFNKNETREIRLYGIAGNDQFKLAGDDANGPRLRMVGGTGKDEFVNTSSDPGRSYIYDDRNNSILGGKDLKLRLRNDTSVHAYKYDQFKYDKSGIRPIAFYSNEDRIYVGLAYKVTKQKWRKEPYGVKHYLDARYSLGQNAFSSTYTSSFRELIGKWDLIPFINVDAIRWTNYYGLGNESQLLTKDRDFHRIRSHELYTSLGLERLVQNKHRISIEPFFQLIDLINDSARFLSKEGLHTDASDYEPQKYTGARLSYVYQKLNDSTLPTRGISFHAHGAHTNWWEAGRTSFQRFGAEVNLYAELTKKIGIMVRAGGASLHGEPPFFVYNKIGGSHSLRGYQRDRFAGNSTFFNQNELRWISDVRSYYFNGKIGLFGMYDMGRVWLDGENSNKWHNSYGAGILISPFNKITLSVAVAKSAEDVNFHFNVINPF